MGEPIAHNAPGLFFFLKPFLPVIVIIVSVFEDATRYRVIIKRALLRAARMPRNQLPILFISIIDISDIVRLSLTYETRLSSRYYRKRSFLIKRWLNRNNDKICRDAASYEKRRRREKERKKPAHRVANINGARSRNRAVISRGRAPSEYSEILITVFARPAKQLHAPSHATCRYA